MNSNNKKSDFRWTQNVGDKIFERVDFTIKESVLDSYKFCKHSFHTREMSDKNEDVSQNMLKVD